MALVQNKIGHWAWVSHAGAKPRVYYPTRDAAVKNAKVRKPRAGGTKDSADRCYTVERTPCVDQ